MVAKDGLRALRRFVAFVLVAASLIAALCLFAPNAHARMATIRASSGATAVVAGDVASKFQALVRRLEAASASIKFMGGFVRRKIAGTRTWSKHASGRAVDICQYDRNIVDRGCKLPANASAIASSVGLKHGAVWGHPDAGHFETPGPNPVATGRRYLASITGKIVYARAH